MKLGVLLLLVVLVSGCNNSVVDETEEEFYEIDEEALEIDEEALEMEILDDPIEECVRVAGSWIEFSNGCVDSCQFERSEEPIPCTAAITEGCDCGPDECWNERTCEAN